MTSSYIQINFDLIFSLFLIKNTVVDYLTALKPDGHSISSEEFFGIFGI